jgi:glutaredoxin
MVVPSVRLTLIGKPDCHLCDDARAVIHSVIDDRDDVSLEELSIHDDAELNEKYWDEIPVLLIDGTVHGIWRFDADRLRAALSV